MKATHEHRELEAELKRHVQGEVRFDPYSRALYATDASIYQMEPIGVVLPRDREGVIATVQACNRLGVPVLPRGGGTSLAGQTVNHAVVIDFSKHLNQVLEVDSDALIARVQPGITLQGLNAHLRPHGLMFAPDPSTANRANVGGAIGNNSCGSHSILYGRTVENVLALEVVLSDGTLTTVAPLAPEQRDAKRAGSGLEGTIYRESLRIAHAYREEVERRFPRILRRVSGYNLDELQKEPLNLAKLLVGSEGTLATVTEAWVKLVPRPKATALGVLHFHSLIEAMEATVSLLTESPAAIELMDKTILDQARAKPAFTRRAAFVQGDPAALLLVEFFGDTETEVRSRLDRLEALAERQRLGFACVKILDQQKQRDPWAVREAGLGLLMSVRGDAKPLPFVEDTAVAPEKLPEYIRRFDETVRATGTTAAYYGHASVGCLHIRPVINLKLQEGVERMVRIANQISDLVLEFGGSLSGEHGDGIVRGVFTEKMFGPRLYQAFRELKRAFDPKGIMNPGRIVDCPPMTENLRISPSHRTVPVTTHLDFSQDRGFAASVEQCNGQGACRKILDGAMCPSYMATREEEHSTRGRANALRAV
ncbi:MAG: FAD-binding oxidoreductase, partial [Chloroflexi bacterium]|nr:FAD-binding oxidoreductase [Chloroflexota bacterium]